MSKTAKKKVEKLWGIICPKGTIREIMYADKDIFRTKQQALLAAEVYRGLGLKAKVVPLKVEYYA